jgi:hypothetical protein
MKDLHDLFADLTTLLEDIHGVAVEGQRAGLSPDVHEVLLAAIRQELRRAHRLILDIAAALP